ncbi:hypothetical protein NIES4103_09180 [Nostoc sp. NIES-4103]|nr:hypothetical protein NIES4103_09180 [Nostoc sp. NIES-4103]
MMVFGHLMKSKLGDWGLGTGYWGTRGPHDRREWGLGAMGIGDWGLGTGEKISTSSPHHPHHPHHPISPSPN